MSHVVETRRASGASSEIAGVAIDLYLMTCSVSVSPSATQHVMRSAARASVASVASARVTRRTFTRRAIGARTRALSEDEVAFMIREFSPWVTDEEGARKCDAYMREKYGLRFNLAKAEVVVRSLREEHAKLPAAAGPFEMPKLFPGFLGVFERCGDDVPY